MAADTPLPVRIEIEELGPLSSEIQTAVYFTCTEAIQNACKHARDASCLRIVLGLDNGLAFEVDDDGPGFTPHRSGNGGLRNMHDRIEAVGGVLTIDAAPGVGTRVRGFVPLPAGRARH